MCAGLFCLEKHMKIMLYGKPESISEAERWFGWVAESHEVFVFQTLPTAERHLIGREVNLVIMDGDDDETDWRYIADHFREINPGLRIVLLSRSADQSVRAYDADLFDYLLKPVKKKQLQRVLSKI